jgi:hypothetical protein
VVVEGGEELVEPGLPGGERGDRGDDAEMPDASPGRASSRSSSTTPTPTSVTATTDAGSRAQLHRLAAKPASARPSPGVAIAYPVSDRSTASRSASATGAARLKSISATVSGSTSAG